MYYNGCFFTKNPSQALSGKTKKRLTPAKIQPVSCGLALALTPQFAFEKDNACLPQPQNL
jgi:hypothetical protein